MTLEQIIEDGFYQIVENNANYKEILRNVALKYAKTVIPEFSDNGYWNSCVGEVMVKIARDEERINLLSK